MSPRILSMLGAIGWSLLLEYLQNAGEYGSSWYHMFER